MENYHSDRIESLKIRFYTAIGRLELEKSIIVTDRQLQIFEAALQSCKSEEEAAACVLGNIRRFESMLVTKSAVQNVISGSKPSDKSTNDKVVIKADPLYECAEVTDKEAILRRDIAQSADTTQMGQFPQISPTSNSSSIRGNRKLTEADISMSTDFRHEAHVGWTAQKEFDLGGEEVDALNNLLERAGVSEQQLNNRETRTFIYDFIQSNNVLDSVKLKNGDQSNRHAPPPPPLIRQNRTQSESPQPLSKNSDQKRAPLPPIPPHRRHTHQNQTQS